MLTRTFFARAPLAPVVSPAARRRGFRTGRDARPPSCAACSPLRPSSGAGSRAMVRRLGGGMHAPELQVMLLTGAQLGDGMRREALRLCGRVVERQREMVRSARRARPSPRAGACFARSAPPTR
ncbi:MAG: hypothetical protein ACLUI3_06890 [Christensenellales bacterium]